MQRCLELSKLPKASKLKSLNLHQFKRTTPGSLAPLFGNVTHSYGGPLDPSHPAAQFRQQSLYRLTPQAYNTGFVLRALPKAVLHQPQHSWPDPPFSPAPARGPGSPRLNMSLLKVIGKHVSKSAVVRSTIGFRVKTALSMIVTRGADVERDEKGRECIVFNEKDAGEKWILPDWTYVIHPTLELYRMPYQTLIPALRQALLTVKQKAQQLDRSKWSFSQSHKGAQGRRSNQH